MENRTRKLEQVKHCAEQIIDAIVNDLSDADHADANGHSNVVEWRVCHARDCFTQHFNELIDDLKTALSESDQDD